MPDKMVIQQYVCLILLILLAFPAVSKQYALVIGNSEYQFDSLANPANDARAMAKLLTEKQYEVSLKLDLNAQQMYAAIDAFSRKLYQEDAVGLFYFAGHGVEVEKRNYLIPIGAEINNETEVQFKAVDVGLVLKHMQKAGNPLNLLILDACRNNPFLSDSRSLSRGLAKMNPAQGTLVMYATSPGTVASDGAGENGLFTKHLMASMNKPGLKIEEVLKSTAQAVYKESAGEQLPWYDGMILGDYYFTLETEQNAVLEPVSAAASPQSDQQAEILFWQTIKNKDQLQYFESYLQQFPQGLFTSLAKLEIEKLSQQNTATKARLNVNVSPEHARVRILNIQPKFKQNMRLDAGKYQLEVSASGYQKIQRWIQLKMAESRTVDITLNKTTNSESDSRSSTGLFRLPSMVNIEAGCFEMGSNLDLAGRSLDQRPHQVCVDRFKLAKHEVSIAEFSLFVAATGYKTEAGLNIKQNGCYAYGKNGQWDWRSKINWKNTFFQTNEQYPVSCISWNDAQRYIAWLNKVSGQSFRLPTEAEWEYAVRAGSSTAYYWSNQTEDACRYANVNDQAWLNSFDCQDGAKFTAQIGQYNPNGFGLYDMTGNVWEWTCSAYDLNYQGAENDCISARNITLKSIVVRGGSFNSLNYHSFSASRDKLDAWKRADDVGLRLAHSW